MKQVLVTGASGFLGGHLVAHLRTSGYRIVAMGRNETRLETLRIQGVETLQCDLSKGVPDCGPVDAIVHCAGLSAPFGRLIDFQQANVAATQNVIKLARKLNVSRLVNISSPTVYFSFRDAMNVTEDTPLPPPVNHYARTKVIAENLVLAASDLNPVNLRPRGIYGTGDRSLLPRLINAAKRGPLPIFRQGRARIDLTHVSDVCQAIEAALNANQSAICQSYNISSGEPLPIQEIVNTVCASLDVPVRWRSTPLAPARALARVLETMAKMFPMMGEPRVTTYALGLFAFEQSLNISKAQNLLGWTPKVSFSEGVELSVGHSP